MTARILRITFMCGCDVDVEITVKRGEKEMDREEQRC